MNIPDSQNVSSNPQEVFSTQSRPAQPAYGMLAAGMVLGVVLTLLGVLGYQKLYSAETASIKPAPVPLNQETSVTPSAITETTTPAEPATVAVKTYILAHENLSFQYPESWKLTAQKPDATFELNSKANVIELESTDGFTLIWQYGIDGVGGYCDEECEKNNLPTEVLATLDFYGSPLYVVLNGRNTSDFGPADLRFSVIPEKTCQYNICYGFEGKNTKGIVKITGRQAVVGTPSPERFKSTQGYKEALQILKSMKYQK